MTQEPSRKTLLYCYGIVGLGTTAFERLRSGAVDGVEAGEHLFWVEAEGLAAAVSRVPEESYDDRGLNEMVNDLARVTPLALRHSEAIHELFLAGPAIVPLSLGAVYRDTAGIERLLREDGSLFKQLLDRFRGKQEWGLKAFGDPAKVAEAAEAESERLRSLARDVEESSPGRGFFLRKRQQRARGEEAASIVERTMMDVFRGLEAFSAEAQIDEVKEARENALPLLFKAAFLVQENRTGEFRTRLEEMREGPSALGIDVQVTGPWAPYTFTKGGPHAKLVAG